MAIETLSRWKHHGGTVSVHDHASEQCGCTMRFGLFTPPQAASGPVPLLWYLSGLTCTWSNMMEKSGFGRRASELGIAIVAPDTSPRGEAVADDEAYDLGQGAGFYLSATEAPWSAHYRMDQYLLQELPAVVAEVIDYDSERQGITGHSMGGHGALTLYLKNPGRYCSVSAFSPITSPSRVPWGQKAFTAYLGEDPTAWAAHDAEQLVRSSPGAQSILIDTGTADNFLDEQLQPAHFIQACREAGQALEYRMQSGYDHSYWFIASFIEDHLRHHAVSLLA